MQSFPVVIFGFLALAAVTVTVLGILRQRERKRRLAFIDTYRWPPGLMSRLRSEHPALTGPDCRLIDLGLRQFFRAYLMSGRRPVSMPSEAVDALWHQFILYTQSYDEFCKRAFGRFLHHTPAVALAPAQRRSNAGLRRVWWHACREERICPRRPQSLPLLFQIDERVRMPGGFVYSPDCEGRRRMGRASGYCGGDFASTSFDGGTAGLGEGGADSDCGGTGSDGGGSDGGGDGGGCGGGGGD